MLGPMPETVRAAVLRLVVVARSQHSDSNGRFLGYLLHGGPGGCDFLDANGDVWSWSAGDDTVERVPDGPRKVGAVAIAAERVPDLAKSTGKRPSGKPRGITSSCWALETHQVGDKKKAEALVKDKGFVNLIQVEARGSMTRDSHAICGQVPNFRVESIQCVKENDEPLITEG